MPNQTITKLTSITIVIAALFLVNSLILAWTAPIQAPPDGNTPTPINIGPTEQYKEGALGIGGVFRTYSNAVIDGALSVAGNISTLAPTLNNHVATKEYVDAAGGGSATSLLLLPSVQNPASIHSAQDCIDAGGSFSQHTDNLYYCLFNSGSCPSGWTAKIYYYPAKTCSERGYKCGGYCSTSAQWGSPGTCNYWGGCIAAWHNDYECSDCVCQSSASMVKCF